MLVWDDDLLIPSAGLFLDSRRPRPLSFVSHAHSDHIGLHTQAIATEVTAAIARHRIGLETQRIVAYREQTNLDRHTMTFHPAGHILGSAMLHIASDLGNLLYTGDFKLRPSLTVETAEPPTADILLMESTYGLPQFRFPAWQTVANELVERCAAAMKEGRQPIVFGYSLGKAQEITKILTSGGLAVTQHGAAYAMSQFYERFGVPLGNVRKYKFEDFHGDHQLDLAERGVLVAPPSTTRTSFVTRFKNPLRIVMTGWALIPGAQFRYGVDVALPLSDHADFDELLELIERVNPKKIYTHHGYKEFAETLRSKGLDAQLAHPEKQLSLFG